MTSQGCVDLHVAGWTPTAALLRLVDLCAALSPACCVQATGLLHETKAPKAAPQQRSVRKGGNANGLGQQRTASDEDSDFSE